MLSRLTARVSQTTALLSGLIGVVNFVNLTLFRQLAVADAVLNPSVWVLVLIMVFFIGSLYTKERPIQLVQAILPVLLSGPMISSSVFDFFGMWFFLLGIMLLYKYKFLSTHTTPKLLFLAVYFLPFLAVGVLTKEGMAGSFLRTANYAILLFSCLAYVYFLFEEQILELLAAHKHKDRVFAEQAEVVANQAAEIARLEPLSSLGERVAHVAHSFKNNLNLLGIAEYHLEAGGNPEKAAQKLADFRRSMTERIDNLLMISRAGADKTEEDFDVAQALAGLNQVYLSEPAFIRWAKVSFEATEPTMVHAIRWDFLLMAENILKNAYDALSERGTYGAVKITLKDRVLCIANDGGAMPLCDQCTHDATHDCLACPKYGKPGRTTKKTGSGHGLAQVFATCRRFGWTLSIRTEGDWTLFKIGFDKEAT